MPFKCHTCPNYLMHINGQSMPIYIPPMISPALTMWPGALYTNNTRQWQQWCHSPITHTELATWPNHSKPELLYCRARKGSRYENKCFTNAVNTQWIQICFQRHWLFWGSLSVAGQIRPNYIRCLQHMWHMHYNKHSMMSHNNCRNNELLCPRWRWDIRMVQQLCVGMKAWQKGKVVPHTHKFNSCTHHTRAQRSHYSWYS